jgi:glycosyltransferase involved in cell wall biosynthesis
MWKRAFRPMSNMQCKSQQEEYMQTQQREVMQHRNITPQSMGLSLVIPAYNEERRLPRTLAFIQQYQPHAGRDLEVLIVDDGSTDATVALVRQWSTQMPGLRLIQRPHLGKGAAVRAGMLAANQPLVVVCDADLSMPIDQLDRLLVQLERGTHCVVGSRELPDSRRFAEPLTRHIMGRVFNLLVRLLIVSGIHDTQCGFKGFHRAVAHDLFRLQRSMGFAFDVEILLLARKRGYSIQEVPIDWHFDADSRVRPIRDTINMVLELLRIRLQYMRGVYATE